MTPPDLAGATWRKSSHSGGGSGQCIELTKAQGVIGVRDSKDPAGPYLYLDISDWELFIGEVKAVARD